MKKIILSLILISSNLSLAQSLLLKADIDPREVILPEGYRLWSEVQADRMSNRPLRDEVITSSTLFLEKRISHSDFVQLLKSWGEQGFNHQERIVLIDTLYKSTLPANQKNQWLCRLDNDRNCAKIRIFPKHLAPILQKYDWLIIDGKAYPRVAWDEISIPDEPMTWIFLSARFETYKFSGKWEDLKFKNPPVENWVTGTCEQHNVLYEVQDMDTNIMIHRNCLKSSVVRPNVEPNFYDKNKKTIWMAAGLLLGFGAFNTMTGNKIIFQKPSFK